MKNLKTPSSALIAFFFLIISSAVYSINFLAAGNTSSFNNASIHYQLDNDNNNSKRNTFLSDEHLTLSFSLDIAPEDVGMASELYLAAIYNQQFYMRDQNAQWQLWDGIATTLVPTSIKTTLSAQETIIVLNNERLPAGEYIVYAAYKTRYGDIRYSAEPASFLVSEQSSAKLHRVQNSSFLNAYLDLDIIQPYRYSCIPGSLGCEVHFGQQYRNTELNNHTTFQETGTDQGYTHLTIGDILFTLENCVVTNTFEQQSALCLSSYQLHESPASASRLDKITLTTESHYYGLGQLFLNESSSQTPANKLIWLSHARHFPAYFPSEATPFNAIGSWFFPQDWTLGTTTVQFFDISVAGSIKAGKSLSLDGMIVTSRKIDNQLYLITRHNGGLWSSPSTYSPLPGIFFEQSTPKSLLAATDCYVPASRSDQSHDGTVTTITRLSIDDPEDFSSTCIAGNIETAYVSADAIYLATSPYPYSFFGYDIVYDQAPEYFTEVHKFSLANQQINYTASGTVPGHLGWDMDSKAFRMGESNGILKVATSLGETKMTSTTRVAVLKENTDRQILEELSFISRTR